VDLCSDLLVCLYGMDRESFTFTLPLNSCFLRIHSPDLISSLIHPSGYFNIILSSVLSDVVCSVTGTSTYVLRKERNLMWKRNTCPTAFCRLTAVISHRVAF
jgi:hypothetical protein